jgi:hypothetical protein
MIEGNLSDVSLPGLLQFLATESNKSYKVSLVSGAQKGELLVSSGEIQSATFGLLEGNDALTELLFWPDGSFKIIRLKGAGEGKAGDGLKIPLKQVNTFADQMVYLREAAVGLNSEIVPSPSFGTQGWQEALSRQPLLKEDYTVLGWATDGRTMRQAMREFNFDVVRATSSLYRLIITGSVSILRPALAAEDEDPGERPINGLAAILDSMVGDDKPEAIIEPIAQQIAVPDALPDAVLNAVPDALPVADVAAAKSEAAPQNNAVSKQDVTREQQQSTQPLPPMAPPVKISKGDALSDLFDATPTRVLKDTATGADKSFMGVTNFSPSDGLPSAGPSVSANSGGSGGAMSVASQSMAGASASHSHSSTFDREVITCDSLPAVGSAEFNDLMARAQKASEEVKLPAKETVKDQAQKELQEQKELREQRELQEKKEMIAIAQAKIAEAAARSESAIVDSIVSAQAETQQIHLPTSFRTSGEKISAVTAGGVTIGEAAAKDGAVARAAAAAREVLHKDINMGARPQIKVDVVAAGEGSSEEQDKDNPEKRLFDMVRTDPLPIVAIDIERLFQTNFHVSPFGHISLGNDVLDPDMQKILQNFKLGKTFITVATEEGMIPAQVLHDCKFCLERGFLDPPDAVASLTADLLLGRVELEQYLLQRRRITGDELRDVVEVARQKSIKLTDLLVKLGFMTASDWDRLCQEKERFARR